MLLLLDTWNSVYNHLIITEKKHLDSFVPLIDFGILRSSEDGDNIEKDHQNHIRELVKEIGSYLEMHHRQ